MMSSREYLVHASWVLFTNPEFTFAEALAAVNGSTPKRVRHGLGQIKLRLPKRWPSIGAYEKWRLEPHNADISPDSPYYPLNILSETITIQPWTLRDHQRYPRY